MNRLYLVVFIEIDRKMLTDFLDTRNEISFWFYDMANSIFIRTNLDSRQLSELIESRFGQIRHLVVPVTGEWGRLPKDDWKHFDI